MKHNYKKRIQEFTFILPAMILFLVFVVYPFLQKHFTQGVMMGSVKG